MKKYTLFFSVFFLSLMVSFTANAQWGKWGKGISGKGPKVTKTLNLDNISSLGVTLGANVYMTQGNKQEVEIKAQQNIIDLLDKDVRNGNWEIQLEKGTNLKHHDGIDIYITIPTVEKLSIAGSGSIIGKTKFNDLDDLKVNIAGSGDIDLSGSGEDLKVSVAGSGEVEMAGFEVNNCDVSIAGSGDCEVNVSSNLKVSIAGSGDVKYKGNPDKVKSNIAGSGDVRSF